MHNWTIKVSSASAFIILFSLFKDHFLEVLHRSAQLFSHIQALRLTSLFSEHTAYDCGLLAMQCFVTFVLREMGFAEYKQCGSLPSCFIFMQLQKFTPGTCPV